MSTKRAGRYKNDFKEEAVKLALELGTSKAADQLGVPCTTLSGWRSKHEAPFRGVSSISKNINLEEENRILRKENQQLKKIADLLKKTTAIISQDLL